MNRFYSGLQSLRSKAIRTVASAAAFGLVLAPVSVQAQAAATQVAAASTKPVAATSVARPAMYTDNLDISAREFFNLREYVRGVPMSQADYETLRDHSCVIGPSALVAKLQTRALEKGQMCSKAMYDKLDGLNKEGTPLTVSIISGGTLTVSKSLKGINAGQNYIQNETYSLASNSDGKPMTVTYNYHANGGQYMAQMLASLPATILGATLPGITAKVLNSCDGNCQSGIINVVSAASDSTSLAAVQSQQTTVVGVPAGCNGPCVPTPTHPRD